MKKNFGIKIRKQWPELKVHVSVLGHLKHSTAQGLWVRKYLPSALRASHNTP